MQGRAQSRVGECFAPGHARRYSTVHHRTEGGGDGGDMDAWMGGHMGMCMVWEAGGGDGKMSGWTDGWTDGWMDGGQRVDGWVGR